MPPFAFRLEQVRVYRRQLEEQAMQALARAVMQRDAVHLRIEALEKERDAQRVQLGLSHSMTAAERWMTGRYEEALRLDIAEARAHLAELEKQVDACRADLVEKAKARGLLDKLREKQAAQHLRRELQTEQHCNDETATLRHRPVTV